MASFESEAAKRIDILEKTTRKLQARNVPDFYMGWTNIPVLPVYASATSVTFAGVDLTAHFTIGVKCAWYQSAGWRYGYVLSSSYSVGNTTLNFVANTSFNVANTAISIFRISYGSPPDFPGGLNWAPNIVALTVVGTPTYLGRFKIADHVLHFWISLSATTSIASSAGSSQCDNLPVVGSYPNNCYTSHSGAVGMGVGLVDPAFRKAYFPTWAASGFTFYTTGWYEI